MKLLFRLIVLSLLLNSYFCFGQVSYSNYRLVVLVEAPNKKIEEKLDLNELTAYHQEIEIYNSNLKNCVDLFWKTESKPEYLGIAQVNQLIASKAINTLILSNSKYSLNYADFSSYKLSNKLYQSRDVAVENYNKKQLPYRASMIELKRADLPNNSSAVATVAMPSIFSDNAELTYAIKSLALQIDYKNKGTTEVQLMKMYIKNAPHLKDLTLLINQNDLDESVKSEVSSHYKLAFQLVNKDAIDKAILTSDKSKAIALQIPNNDGSFSFKVFDASTMEILGQSNTLPPSEYYPELNNKIKGNHLEDFTHYCD